MCTHASVLGPDQALHLAWRLTAGDIKEDYVCALCLSPITKDQKGCLRSCPIQGHTLVVDVQRQELISTSPCKDYVYLDAFDRAVQLVHAADEKVQRGVALEEPTFGPAYQILEKRRRLLEQSQGIPGYMGLCAPQSDLLEKEFSEAQPPDGLPLGLRGLNNLGNTCFMNCVLQALIHAPLMRNYFLGDGHNPAHCEVEEGKPCLGCELDAVFSNMFSGDRQPFSPADFLFSWWTVADHLAEYQQQDAHEFYLSALSALCPATIKPPAGPLHCAGLCPAAGAVGRPPSMPNSIQGASDGPATVRHGAVMSGEPARLAHTAQQPVLLPQATALPHRSAAAAAAAAAAASGHPNAQQQAQQLQGPLPAGAPLLPPLQCQEHPRPQTTKQGQPEHSLPGPSDTGVPKGVCQVKQEEGAGRVQGGQLECVHGLKQDGTQSLVDAVFRGTLRSDVTCTVCGYTSTAYDPFLDISLDLLPMLEAAKQQQVSQLAQLGNGSQAGTRAAAAASGIEGAAGSVRSCQPSASLPSSSPPSQSGMTDAFSGVEGASFAGAGRHDAQVSARWGGHASTAPSAAEPKPGSNRSPPVAANGSLPIAAKKPVPDGDSPAVSHHSPTVAATDPPALWGAQPPQGGRSMKRAAQEAFGENNALLHAGCGRLRLPPPPQQQQQQLVGLQAFEREAVGLAGTPGLDMAATMQPSGASQQAPAAGRTALAESMSSDDEVITSPAQGQAGQQRLMQQQQQQCQWWGLQMQPHPPAAGQQGPCLQGGSVNVEGSGSGCGGGILGTAVPTPAHQEGGPAALQAPVAPQPSYSHTCSMQSEGGGWVGEATDPLALHPLLQEQQQLTHEYPPNHLFHGPGGSMSAVGPLQEDAARQGRAGVGKGGKGSRAGSRAAGKGGKGGAKHPATPRVSTRCGECHTCLNRYMKKACLRNKALKDGVDPAAWLGANAAAAPTLAAAAAATAAAELHAAQPGHLPPSTTAPSLCAGSGNVLAVPLPPPPASSSTAAEAAAVATEAAEAAAAAAMRPSALPHAHTHVQGRPRAALRSAALLPTPQPPLPPQPPGAAVGRTAHGPPAPVHPPFGLPPISSLPGGIASTGQPGAQGGDEEGGPPDGANGLEADAGAGASAHHTPPACSGGLPPRPPPPATRGAQHQTGGVSNGWRGGGGGGGAAQAGPSPKLPQQQQPRQTRSNGPSSARTTTSQVPQAAPDLTHASGLPTINLAACLQHYVQPERLTSSASWVCSCCQCTRPAVKQMSILRLPPVLCLHIKRFEYAPQSHRMLRKLQAPLFFPMHELDMAPFLTSAVLRQRYNCRGGYPMAMASTPGAGLAPLPSDKTVSGEPLKPEGQQRQTKAGTLAKLVPDGKELQQQQQQQQQQQVPGPHMPSAQELGPPQSTKYQLSTVICHKGDITGGHYVAYVRNMGAWFRCDDAWVTLVSEEEVAQCQAYMLFFVQSMFC